MEKIIGKKFSRLTAVKFVKKEKNVFLWLFACDCGNKKIININSVKNKQTRSCGCLRRELVAGRNKENYKHGFYGTRFYTTWQNMKKRCLYKKDTTYSRYGGRGIKICFHWLKFENFKKDMYKDYLEHCNKFGEKNTTIGRIDNNDNYGVNNCQWETWEEQANNRENNCFIFFNNKKLSVRRWENILGFNHGLLWQRINVYKWSIERAFTTPVIK